MILAHTCDDLTGRTVIIQISEMCCWNNEEGDIIRSQISNVNTQNKTNLMLYVYVYVYVSQHHSFLPLLLVSIDDQIIPQHLQELTILLDHISIVDNANALGPKFVEPKALKLKRLRDGCMLGRYMSIHGLMVLWFGELKAGGVSGGSNINIAAENSHTLSMNNNKLSTTNTTNNNDKRFQQGNDQWGGVSTIVTIITDGRQNFKLFFSRRPDCLLQAHRNLSKI